LVMQKQKTGWERLFAPHQLARVQLA